jgi:hypothetical protein
MWYELIPSMPEERLFPLMQRYDEMIQEQRELKELFGVI